MKNNDKVYADLMISNGKIATLDERGTMAEAVAVKDGKFWLSVPTKTSPNTRDRIPRP